MRLPTPAGPRPVSGSLAESLWLLALASAVAAAAIGLLRLVGDSMYWVGHFNKVLNPLMALVALLALLRMRRVRVDALSVVAGASIALGCAVAVGRGGEARPFVAHLFSALFFLLLYGLARSRPWPDGWRETFLRRASGVILGCYFVTVPTFWLLRAIGLASYIGVSNDLLVPLAYYATRKRWLLTLVCLALILASGKRGVYVAVLAMAFLVAPVPGRKRLTTLAVTGLVGSALLLTAVYAAEPYVRQLPLGEGASALLDKWYLTNPLRADFDLGRASSGRWGEIQTSMAHFQRHDGSWWIGLGYGWSYFNSATTAGSETLDFVAHYVHLSPLNYLYLYGLPLAGLFLGLIWRATARAYRWSVLRRGRHSAEYGWVVYFVGSLVSSLTGYSLAIDPWFPLTLGLLVSMADPASDPRPGADSPPGSAVAAEAC